MGERDEATIGDASLSRCEVLVDTLFPACGVLGTKVRTRVRRNTQVPYLCFRPEVMRAKDANAD